MDPSNRTLDSMIAIADPSQLSAFAHPQANEERPFKRRVISDADEPILELEEDEDEVQEVEGGVVRSEVKGREVAETPCEFTSITELRRLARKKGNLGERLIAALDTNRFGTDVSEIMQQHAFVGIVDRQMCLSLLQHGTKLYLVRHASLGYFSHQACRPYH